MPKENQSYFEIRSSSIQGRGAFATRRIRKGTRLIEYVGERISHAEADRRYDDDTMRRHHTFLFTLNNRTVIDAAVNGNEARYMNHSCDPNCEAVIDGSHIYIESIRTIQPGTELVYDYQYERAPDADESDEARYPCRCGSPNCRGTILAPPKPAKRKRAAAKKGSAKKGSVKKGSAKKGSAKKGSARKGSAKKGSAKKGSAKKGSAKKGSAKKGSAKKGSVKKGSAKKGSAKKGSARKVTKKATKRAKK